MGLGESSPWRRQHDQIPFLGRSFKSLYRVGPFRGISDPWGSGVDVVLDGFSGGAMRGGGEN